MTYLPHHRGPRRPTRVSPADLADRKEQFHKENPDLIKDLYAINSWNDFAASLTSQFEWTGRLSERQIDAAYSMLTKIEANRMERELNGQKDVDVDLAAIRAMFDHAISTGHQRPSYRAEGLKITLAGANSRNAGALYVVDIDSDEYQGKIVGTSFKPVKDCLATTAPGLRTIAKDPEAASVRYGQKTGNCGICGRLLTNHESIERGIGPICAERMGF